jgi:hypothetical protein
MWRYSFHFIRPNQYATSLKHGNGEHWGNLPSVAAIPVVGASGVNVDDDFNCAGKC